MMKGENGMELRKATHTDLIKVIRAIGHKDLPYITKAIVDMDYRHRRMYVVADGEKVLATVSLVEETLYGYMAVKRLCILNKRNYGKGIARFALHELQKVVNGKIGATPWKDNCAMRHILESEGFTLQYTFNEVWCFYAKEVG